MTLGALPRIRELRDHAVRRLKRMELLALGGRVDFGSFGHERAYQVGSRDALNQVVAILNESIGQMPPGGDVTVELARQGLDVDRIAGRCGVTPTEVAQVLAEYVAAAPTLGEAIPDEQDADDPNPVVAGLLREARESDGLTLPSNSQN